jgi:anaerobic magnesium-protoporphyrin IX monomethyl ester cyclase
MSERDVSRILLATPPYHCGVVEVAGRWLPLSLVYLAGSAEDAGWSADIYDAMTKQHNWDVIEKYLASQSYDAIGVTAITASFPAALKLLQLSKKLHPNAKTIMGGVHPTFMYESLLAEHGDVIDIIVRGEGELTLRELLKHWNDPDRWHEIPGLSFNQDGTVVHTLGRQFINDLNTLPLPYQLLDWEDYRYFVIPNSRLGAISTSRGCDHDCTFCSQQKFWKRHWRGRSAESVAAEVDRLYRDFGANVLLLTDEYPTQDRDRWEELLDRIIARGYEDFYLLMETRVEDIVRDRDIMAKYRKAGIVHIYIGIEATDQETLDRVKKEISVDESQEAIDLIRRYGMVSETSFVLGFPEETSKSVERTLKLAQDYDPDFAHFLAITPWPYADIYAELEPFIEVHDLAQYNLIEPIVKPIAMTRDEIDRAIIQCYFHFYKDKMPKVLKMKDPFVKDYMLRSMKLIMKSSFLATKMGKYAHGAFKEKMMQAGLLK